MTPTNVLCLLALLFLLCPYARAQETVAGKLTSYEASLHRDLNAKQREFDTNRTIRKTETDIIKAASSAHQDLTYLLLSHAQRSSDADKSAEKLMSAMEQDRALVTFAKGLDLLSTDSLLSLEKDVISHQEAQKERVHVLEGLAAKVPEPAGCQGTCLDKTTLQNELSQAEEDASLLKRESDLVHELSLISMEQELRTPAAAAYNPALPVANAPPPTRVIDPDVANEEAAGKIGFRTDSAVGGLPSQPPPQDN